MIGNKTYGEILEELKEDCRLSYVKVAEILDISKSTVYYFLNPEKREEHLKKMSSDEEKRTYKFINFKSAYNTIPQKENSDEIEIDIDKFLNDHKTCKFEFDYEKSTDINERSFFVRLIKCNDDILSEAPSHISELELRKYFGFNIKDFKVLREIPNNNMMTIKKTKTPRYLHDKKYVLAYVLETYDDSRLKMCHIIPKKCFYTIKEAKAYLEQYKNISVTTMTINRKINEGKIPAIRLGGQIIRIPVDEFKQIEHRRLFSSRTRIK
jgi:excisionase family DNA binding protein